MDPSSFLDSSAVTELSEWNSSWPAEEIAGGNQIVTRKRRASEVMNESLSKNCGYKVNGTTPVKQSRGKNAG